MTIERVFVGWDRPFLSLAAAELLSDRDALPSSLVIVPTSHAGRRLREAMAEEAGALLSPKIVTPGSLLKTPDPKVAADWLEQLAWLETLEEINDWSAFVSLLPEAPEQGRPWAEALSQELVTLRRSLQENGLTLESAAMMLGQSIEAERWTCLKQLEKTMESKLRLWGHESRSRVLARGIPFPEGVTRIVLAGISELPPILRKALQTTPIPKIALIGAPIDEAELFCEFGTPLAKWTEKISPLPEKERGSVILVADSKHQASEALRVVAEASTESPNLAIGCGDASDGEALARCFSENGWSAFHPGARSVETGIVRWFSVWSQWLAKPDLKIIADLLALPETEALIGQSRAEMAASLAQLRSDFMISGSDDLRRLRSENSSLRDFQKQMANRLLPTLQGFEKHREAFARDGFGKAIHKLLSLFANIQDSCSHELTVMHEFVERAAPLMHRMKRKPDFWVNLMLSQIPSPVPKPPDDRVIDIQGWLELFFEPGMHLVLCGMNEGRVPAANSNDPWLGENARQRLGLITANQRAARDAFLFHSMVEARRNKGRVDILCAKSGARGEALLPSRFLLNTTPKELPQRVKKLFAEIQPPESSLAWSLDWSWRPTLRAAKQKISATAIRSYIACPFRFYLKHICGMDAMEPERKEWNARDFGTIPHDILQAFGKDADAKESTDPTFIGDWLSSRLDEIVARLHGKSPALAIRIQTEAIRQRLRWAAEVQAEQRKLGWQIIDVEIPVKIQLGDVTIAAQIDRIDRHEKSGDLRVVDYKTGKVTPVQQAHMKKERAERERPAHLAADDCPLYFTIPGKTKPELHRWVDLQLPLYAQAIVEDRQVLAYPTYFHLGATPKDVCVSEWNDFSHDDLESAINGAKWVIQQIQAGIFWPPAEKPTYDDFAILSCGKKLADVCEMP
jgi:ATP-dependent helicase/nuclease subunit B